MCKPYSCIFTNEFKVLDHPSSESHEDIVDRFGLLDNLCGAKREWLQVEITPLKSFSSIDPKEWSFKLDADRPLPRWYNYEVAENLTKQRLFDLINQNRYLNFKGDLHLRNIQATLPEGLTSVGGSLYVEGYNHPLPEGLTSVGKIYK